jgi:hypothetical protein
LATQEKAVDWPDAATMNLKVCTTRSTASAFGIAPSNQTQQQKQQNCLNGFNNSPDGKFYNFFSLASPVIGPDKLQSAIEDFGIDSLHKWA